MWSGAASCAERAAAMVWGPMAPSMPTSSINLKGPIGIPKLTD